MSQVLFVLKSSCGVEKLSQLPFFFIAERCWNDIDTV